MDIVEMVLFLRISLHFVADCVITIEHVDYYLPHSSAFKVLLILILKLYVILKEFLVTFKWKNWSCVPFLISPSL